MSDQNAMTRTNQPEMSLATSNPAAVAMAQKERSRIEAAYTMAMARPRNEDDARRRILDACQRPGFAERVEYRKPVGGGSIVGPSIRYAELALRAWGNVQTDMTTIHEDDETRRVKVVITDMETNTSFSKEITVSKTVERKSNKGRDVVRARPNSSGETVYIVRATDDELQNKEAALLSKALRTEGLRLIPQDITDEAIATARATMANRDAKDPDTARRAMIDAFASLGISATELERHIGHSTKGINPAELVELRAIYQTIRDGEAKWSDYRPDADKATPQPSGANFGPAAEVTP